MAKKRKSKLQKKKDNPYSKYWRTKADKLWSKTVRDRANNKCEICGSTKQVQAHHILKKEFYPLYRYDLNNGIALCMSHHKWSKVSVHSNSIYFWKYIIDERSDIWNWVMQKYKNTRKSKINYYKKFQKLQKECK